MDKIDHNETLYAAVGNTRAAYADSGNGARWFYVLDDSGQVGELDTPIMWVAHHSGHARISLPAWHKTMLKPSDDPGSNADALLDLMEEQIVAMQETLDSGLQALRICREQHAK